MALGILLSWFNLQSSDDTEMQSYVVVESNEEVHTLHAGDVEVVGDKTVEYDLSDVSQTFKGGE
jgi:hypothetical protein